MVKKMGNALGVLGLVFSIIALVLALLVWTVVIGLILGILALIFSIVGIATNDSKAPGIVGLIISIIAIVLAIAILMVFIAWMSAAQAAAG